MEAKQVDSKLVCVVGCGYVGLPLTVLVNNGGHTVIGFDANPAVVESLSKGISTVEDVEDAQLEGITFTTNPADIEQCDVYIICVPTPVTDDKQPDMRIVKAVMKTLSSHAKPGALIILESTVGVGDTKNTFKEFVERGFLVANSPERIDPSRKDPPLQAIPKVVGGVTPEATTAVTEFYKTVWDTVVPVKSSNHSEACKLLENSYRAVNIMFINEFADFCTKEGMDAHEIIDAAATKPYGFSAFRPGVGVGGHCIACDPHYLIDSREDCEWPILQASMDAMHARPAKLASERVNPELESALVVGVSYKPNVSDIRDAPQKHFIEQLKKEGVKVEFYDPLVETFHGTPKVDTLERVEEYDRVYVMHIHKEHQEITTLAAFDHVEFFCQRPKIC